MAGRVEGPVVKRAAPDVMSYVLTIGPIAPMGGVAAFGPGTLSIDRNVGLEGRPL